MLTNNKFIDIHSHILPGLDDGPKSLEESLEIARLAIKNGIETMVATPHHKKGFYTPSKKQIQSALKKFQAALKAEDIPLNVLPGNEVLIDSEIIRPSDKQPYTLNCGSYMLVEFPFDEMPAFSDEILFKLQLKGVTPIIAHPEKNFPIIEDPQIIYRFVDKGCLIQINTSSILGFLGKEVERFSHKLLKEELVDFIASDIHYPYEEILNFSKTMKIAAKYLGEDKALALVRENPLKILKK